jgi:glyoxylase-like metal-dependent hydrolase (beta-lactamase superfamily II)
MPVTRTIGEITLTALDDGAGPFFQPRERAFPDATGADWARADARDPAAVDTTGRWLLRFRCFAIRLADGRTTLVDAGIGPADSPAAAWAPVPGHLPEELAAAGIDPGEVEAVVLTHLHTDHVGWAVTGSPLRPYFRNARYLLQQAEYEAIDALNPALRERLIAPLQATDQLSLIDGDTRLAGMLRVVATPGHTPGHQSVLLDAPDPVLITGDLLVHTLQLIAPHLPYALEVDPATARRSRTGWLAEVAARGGTLATAHLGEPFSSPGSGPTGSAAGRPRPAQR